MDLYTNYTYTVKKTLPLPTYGCVIKEGQRIPLKLSLQRTFKCGPHEEDVCNLVGEEAFYQTIFGWGMYISFENPDELRVTNEGDFKNLFLIPLSETEYQKLL